jgi:hypothetical protein
VTDAIAKRQVAYKYGMAELVPADGEELERVDDHPCAGDVPKPEKHDGIHDYLSIRLERTEGGKGV